MLWETTTECSINRFQGHHCYYKPCSLIYNNTNMFYKRSVQCSGKINHSLLTHSWLSTALSPVVNWIPSNFVLLTVKSTSYGLEEGRERQESSPEKWAYILLILTVRYGWLPSLHHPQFCIFLSSTCYYIHTPTAHFFHATPGAIQRQSPSENLSHVSPKCKTDKMCRSTCATDYSVLWTISPTRTSSQSASFVM